ncbi:PRC-barrel domain-containing protein [Ancylobacter sp. MQZ15Z-1]|uniref:PRC-barrel domain-containing protein n=1 Tax=Ancylobacter mangrovi TaxID=2972472 RepID=A0A9X2PD22_9HYPH|nr:PRC-barrel domain-containing protein [Ancylobacter mangrovi]MCS0496451.1 PRC-barrel domain-containing protein [Ancylobacter mangrovi]
MKTIIRVVLLGGLALGAAAGAARADETSPEPKPMRAEGGAHTQPGARADGLTPQERMNRRFPQKVRVGDLIGLPMQDYDDRVLGYVEKVVRTPDGRIVLVMPYGGFLGYGARPVGIPIETVAILARHLNVLDIPREDFPTLPTWADGEGMPIPADDTIRIAISRR